MRHSHTPFRFTIGAWALILGAAAPCLATERPAPIDDALYAQAQRLVEVEPGRKLNLHCTGSGSPTVVFESGLTDETSAWALVQPALAHRTRACSYDRAGIGFSDAGTRAGSSENIADDLHRLLGAAGIKPPYVLVGHSYGGMNARLYALRHRSDVVGMVLVDPSHENLPEIMRERDSRQLTRAQWQATMAEPNLTLRRRCVAQSVIGFAPQSELTKLCGFPPDARFGDKVNTAHQALYMRPAFQQAQLTEEENIYATSAEQLRAAQRSFGELPLIVLSAEGRVNPAETPEQRERKEMRARLMFKLHQQLAELSIHGVVRSVPNAGHNIHFDQPEAVIAAIMEVLDQAAKP